MRGKHTVHPLGYASLPEIIGYPNRQLSGINLDIVMYRFGQVGTRNRGTPQAIDTTVVSIPRGVVFAASSIGRDGEFAGCDWLECMRNLPGAGIQ
jgi:hypothetical protein